MFTKTPACEVHMISHRMCQLMTECNEAMKDSDDLGLMFIGAYDALKKLESGLEKYRPPMVREADAITAAKMARAGELDGLDSTKAVKP
ncbi:MAG: hypothetical protein NTX56_05620 [Proteobacteria bacterium]|nr:hypothetical protein [Pseudomonadota bacterium]